MAKHDVWVLGQHAVDAVLRVNPERAIELWMDTQSNKPAHRAILQLAEQYAIAIHSATRRELDSRCQSDNHQGVALLAKPKSERHEQQLIPFLEQLTASKIPLLLVLDQIQDPHNFGACLRTADAAGADAVIVPRDHGAPVSAVVQKVASGATETMPIFRVSNLARTLDSLKQAGLWVIGTSDQAPQSLYQQTLTMPLALVMGGEGKGLRRLTEKKCDTVVSLPMSGSIVSSLNVSVATGVCLYEILRQRQID